MQQISQRVAEAPDPTELQVSVPRLLIKRKHTLPIAVGAAAAGVLLVLFATGAAAHTGPRVSVDDAVPAELAPLQRPVDHFQHLIHTVAQRIRVEERQRERRAAEAAARKRRELFAQLPGGVTQATLDSIAACESGGDPAAVSSDGTYRGLYQFDQGTWESVGGSGDPAAASAAEQSYRAALLYTRSGSSPWPVCG
jgi:soluble lytic murein transglycosylase-like protein